MNSSLTPILITFALVWSSVFSSCKNEIKPKLNEEPIKQEVEESPKKDAFILFKVNVDELRLREGKKKNSKVIKLLKEGSFVTSKGESSNFTEKATLREVDYDEPYLKINANNHYGWAYGGGLTKLYSQAYDPGFDSIALNIFLSSLKNVKGTSLEKGSKILQIIAKNNRESADWNDMMYLMGEYYIDQLNEDHKLWERLEKREWSREEYDAAFDRRYDMKSNPLSQRYALAGFKFDSSEGMIFQVPDPEVLKKFVSSPVTQTILDYQELRKTITDEKIFSDASLVGTQSQLVSMIVKIERFISSYPSFVRNDKLINRLEYLHKAIQYGVSNTPSMSDNGDEVYPGWMDAWNQYLKELPNGQIQNEVRKLVEKFS